MTLYQYFNEWVYEYYMENFIPDRINTLTIPSSVLDSFKIEHNCSFTDFNEIKRGDWSLLTNESNGIPMYFGLITLQCHAAHLMQNIDKITTGNYKKPFADLIGLNAPNELESLFSENITSPITNKVQELIWFKAKEHLKKKGYRIELPDKKKGAGRYIQFPKAQVVLNYQDLKEYNNLLQHLNKKFENQVFSYNDFVRILNNDLPRFIRNFERKNNTNQNLPLGKKHIKFKQIFDYYNSSDWNNNLILDESKLDVKQMKLIIKLNEFDFQIYNQEYELLPDTKSNEILRKYKFMLFEQSPFYHNEYETVKVISPENNNIVLIYNSPSNKVEIKELNRRYKRIVGPSDKKNTLLYKINPLETLPAFLDEMVVSEYPVKLIGYKVLGSKKYFTSAPPKIVSKEAKPFVLYWNNKRISHTDVKNAGNYTIKINGYTNYNFQLIDSPKLEFNCQKNENSLSFKTLEVVEKNGGHMCGLIVKHNYDTFQDNKLSVNIWVRALSGERVSSGNQILRAIAQKHYGKNI